MTDLRQGVTAAQHDVLDLLDECREHWSTSLSGQRQLEIADQYCQLALQGGATGMLRFYLVQAAARLLYAIDHLDTAAKHMALIEARIATAPDGDDGA